MLRSDMAVRVRPLGRRPTELTDLYHRLMGASWGGLSACFAVSFLAFNLIFAWLYWLDPLSLNFGAHPIHASRFWRCFFFSVQTVATIGYGNMFPVTLYANIVVVVEITLGILFFALSTGLAFARFSRPTARILFSRVAVVAPFEGVPTLMLRAANQRHNLIFEAHATLSVLADDVVGESRMRRFEALRLVRDNNPAFALTWTMMHKIDDDSPLRAWLAEGGPPANGEIVVVLSGTDSSSGQAMHGRWAYQATDICWNARFADILGRDDAGAMTIDYDRFHEVVPLGGGEQV
jgi:inward rectifier potassium channel